MGHWNYRVLRHHDGSLAIHEVFYDGDGKPESCSKGPTGFVGDSLDELASVLKRAERALREEPLEYASFGKARSTPEES